MKTIEQANTSNRRFINMTFQVDMSKSATQIHTVFKNYIESVKRYRNKKGLDKKPKKLLGKQRVHDFCEDDFRIYDRFNQLKREKGAIPFYRIARQRLSRGNIDVIDSDIVDIEA